MKGPGKIHGLFFFRGNFKFSFVKIYMEKSKHLCYDVKDEIEIQVRGTRMKVSYNGLWKKLIDNNMQKKDLIKAISISSTTIAKMGKGEKVSLDVLERICEYFNCDVGDVMSFEKDGQQGN